MNRHLTENGSVSTNEMGEFICTAGATNVVPPIVWYLLSCATLTAGIPIMLASVSLLDASQPAQRYGGQVALGVGGILILIAALTCYSGFSKPLVYKVRFYSNGVVVFGGPNAGVWMYHDVGQLSVHVIHPGPRLSLTALFHAVVMLLGCVVFTFRQGQRMTTSYDYLFGGGHILLALSGSSEQQLHVYRYSRLNALGAVVRDSSAKFTVSSQPA